MDAGRRDDAPLIRLVGVVRRYETAAGTFTALRNVDLTVGGGEFVAVIGKSGSGKTTLVNTIAAIDRPTEGEVWVAGTPVHELTEREAAAWRGRNLGVVFQFFQLLPTLSALDNVVLPMEFCGVYSPRERRDRARALLDQVGIGDRADRLPSGLSSGQQQRVAVARALANDPPVIVADEPTGNLDSRTADEMLGLFDELVAEGKTLVIVTHDDDLAERATRTVLVADGEVVNEYVRRALAPLDVDEVAATSARLRRVQYAPGAVVVREGERAEDFFIVTSGAVDVFLRHRSGREVAVNRLGPGEYFGEIALLQGGFRTATVRAARDAPAELMALDREGFLELLERSETTRAELERVAEARLGAGTR